MSKPKKQAKPIRRIEHGWPTFDGGERWVDDLEQDDTGLAPRQSHARQKIARQDAEEVGAQ